MLGRMTGKVNEKSGRRNGLLQLRVLGFGLLEDGDVGVGVLPEGEEVFVGGERPDAGGSESPPNSPASGRFCIVASHL